MPTSDYTPSLDTVGALLRARTKDDQGREVGTFTSNTRPTDIEVEALIGLAVSEAYPVFGENVPDDPTPGGDPGALRTAAAQVVALRAAALVEQSYYPEQVARGASPYPMIQQSFNDGLKRVATAIAEVEAGDEPGEDAASTMPVSDFPVDTGGMIGWGNAF